MSVCISFVPVSNSKSLRRQHKSYPQVTMKLKTSEKDQNHVLKETGERNGVVRTHLSSLPRMSQQLMTEL